MSKSVMSFWRFYMPYSENGRRRLPFIWDVEEIHTAHTFGHVHGYVQFNGRDDSDLIDMFEPYFIRTSRIATEPRSVVRDEKEEETVYTHDVLERHHYRVEFYRHEVLADTSESSYDPEVGFDVCFVPTARQRLCFRVLEEFPPDEEDDAPYIVREGVIFVPNEYPIVDAECEIVQTEGYDGDVEDAVLEEVTDI